MKLTPEGALDKKQTVNIFKGNMTDEMNQKTTAIWDNCIDEAGIIEYYSFIEWTYILILLNIPFQ